MYWSVVPQLESNEGLRCHSIDEPQKYAKRSAMGDTVYFYPDEMAKIGKITKRLDWCLYRVE